MRYAVSKIFYKFYSVISYLRHCIPNYINNAASHLSRHSFLFDFKH